MTDGCEYFPPPSISRRAPWNRQIKLPNRQIGRQLGQPDPRHRLTNDSQFHTILCECPGPCSSATLSFAHQHQRFRKVTQTDRQTHAKCQDSRQSLDDLMMYNYIIDILNFCFFSFFFFFFRRIKRKINQLSSLELDIISLRFNQA